MNENTGEAWVPVQVQPWGALSDAVRAALAGMGLPPPTLRLAAPEGSIGFVPVFLTREAAEAYDGGGAFRVGGCEKKVVTRG